MFRRIVFVFVLGRFQFQEKSAGELRASSALGADLGFLHQFSPGADAFFVDFVFDLPVGDGVA